MKKRILAVVCVALLMFGFEAKAVRPAGWNYFQLPNAYMVNEFGWYYFNQPDTQWCYDYQNNQWRELKQSAIATGWSYFAWPYAYSSASGSWFYLNETDTQWCYSFNDQVWSKLGVVVGNVSALGVNNSYSNLCAEYDNVDVALMGNVTSFLVIATHPLYNVTNYEYGTDFSNASTNEETNYVFSPFTQTSQFNGGWMKATREPLWWKPEGMTLMINGSLPVQDIHMIEIGKNIPGTTEWPGYFVLYSDGNMRLIPFPPAGHPSVVFGSSVIIGPAPVAFRPSADIASVDFQTSPAFALLVTYRTGGTAIIDYNTVTRTNAIVKVMVNYPTIEPFCTFRSMFVADGNADCDHVEFKTVNGMFMNSPIMPFISGRGKEWFFYRETISRHNQSSADIRIVIK